MFTRALFDPFVVYAAAFGLTATILMAFTVRAPYRTTSRGNEVAHLMIATVFCTSVAWWGGGNVGAALLAAGFFTVAGAGLRILLPRLTLAGAMAMATMPLGFVCSIPWVWLLLRESGASEWLLILPLIGAGLSLFWIAIAFAETLVRSALLTHAVWRQPHQPLASGTGRQPRVSIHLPCYAEPPEVVIATIDRLARLDYADFEVLVCDNNTPDEALWRPLEAHCARLNAGLGREQFRFFHVAPLAGAKAGALNWLLDRTDPQAELVAVIDADYHSQPDFLSRIVGFFDDPTIGYVQTPHDYRGWKTKSFLSACYWEYMPNNKVELSGLNEYGAAFTIGTMCVIRRAELEAAGRWAEWCLTEDSEVSVRLRMRGQRGIYLRETFGRGLIPESFADYKKQRFRWTAGPVQQLRRHWRYYVPGPWFVPSALDRWSRFLEVQRGVAPVLHALGIFGAQAGLLIFIALAAYGALPTIRLPAAAWLVMAIGTASAVIGRWHRYRLCGCARISDMLRGELARLSLGYVQMVAGVAGLSARPLEWRRTPKFGTSRQGLAALADTLPETLVGFAHLMLIAVPIFFLEDIGSHMAGLMIAACVFGGLSFLTSPIMALLSERGLTDQRDDALHDPALADIPATASIE